MANSIMDVESEARRVLATSPIFDVRTLHVERSGETLLLSGRVASFYHKQLAQEAVRAVASGVTLVNSVNVD